MALISRYCVVFVTNRCILDFVEVSVTVRGVLVFLVGVVVTGNTGDVPRHVLGYLVSLTRPWRSTLHLICHPKSVKIIRIPLIYIDFHRFLLIP